MNNLGIVYRACGKELPGDYFNESRPFWFDKLKCWESFYSNFNKNCDIHVVFDGEKNNPLSEHIGKYNDVNIEYINNAGNKNSLLYCYELMDKLSNMYLGLFEDDYLWLPNSYKIALEGLTNFGSFGTISLYQHPDRITRQDDITLGHEYILATNSCYWRTAESNTATFLIRNDLFKKSKQEFIDCHIQDRLLFVNLLKKHGLRHFTPISSLYGCSHVNRFFPALFTNWEEYNNSIKF